TDVSARWNHGHSLAHTNIAGENCTTKHTSPGGQGVGGSMPHGVPELLAASTHTPLVAPKTGEKQTPLPQLPQAAPTGEQVTSGGGVGGPGKLPGGAAAPGPGTLSAASTNPGGVPPTQNTEASVVLAGMLVLMGPAVVPFSVIVRQAGLPKQPAVTWSGQKRPPASVALAGPGGSGERAMPITPTCGPSQHWRRPAR